MALGADETLWTRRGTVTRSCSTLGSRQCDLDVSPLLPGCGWTTIGTNSLPALVVPASELFGCESWMDY